MSEQKLNKRQRAHILLAQAEKEEKAKIEAFVKNAFTDSTLLSITDYPIAVFREAGKVFSVDIKETFAKAKNNLPVKPKGDNSKTTKPNNANCEKSDQSNVQSAVAQNAVQANEDFVKPVPSNQQIPNLQMTNHQNSNVQSTNMQMSKMQNPNTANRQPVNSNYAFNLSPQGQLPINYDPM